jgi:hypothetical protein
MSKNLHIELLSEIDSHGIMQPFNVSPFMVKHFARPPYLGGDNAGWDNKKEQLAKGFLRQLLIRNYIYYDADKLDSTIYYMSVTKVGKEIDFDQWFDNNDFEILFTLNGLEYLNQNRHTQSNFALNETSIRNLKSQKSFSITTIVIAFLAALISLLNLMYAKNSNDTTETLKQQVEVMQKELLTLKALKAQPKSHTTSPVNFYRTR